MKGTEQGFNTDARQSTTLPSGPSAGVCDTVDCNSKTDEASYTRDIQLSEVGQCHLTAASRTTIFSST